jgi:anti-sigma28 factor (negative regulator of flagellin synthesis)
LPGFLFKMEKLERYHKKNIIKSFEVKAYIRHEEVEEEESTYRVRGYSSPNFILEFSEPALALQEIRDIMNSSPKARSEKIFALKKKIEEGTYTPPSLRIAGKILKNSVHRL